MEGAGKGLKGRNDMDENREMWERCAAFHGHVCGGLMIGYKASLLATELLNLSFSKDEQVVCVAENDACGVDAIQVMLGCSVGKGNLLFHICGKQAFSFYERKSGKSVRLVLKALPEDLSRSGFLEYCRQKESKELFDVKETVIQLPSPAKIFDSYICECCGEKTGANWVRIINGKKLCLDCCDTYDRFNI